MRPSKLFDRIPIYPLITFRILFGLMMLLSIIRFAAKGWIADLYISPALYFPYLGFEWVKPLGDPGMYLLFALMGLAALGIMMGAAYRLSTFVFFLTFTYVELLDKTNYLNHYYFVSIVSFLLIFLPANRAYAIDCLRKPGRQLSEVPRWTLDILKFQLAVVYVFAGIAKLHPDWLFHALPLKIWLTSKTHIPLLGWIFNYDFTAYVFSWFGAIYDLFIVFFLLYPPSRILAYITVVVFHLLTGFLFPIGMFPYIMILSTLIFFSPTFHKKLLSPLDKGFRTSQPTPPWGSSRSRPIVLTLLGFYILIQLLIPFRYVLYPGDLFWTEEGYRFSWRVMLMEKAGYAQFEIYDPHTGQREFVQNYQYLTPTQEKMMSTQPDMILQFAHFLVEEYKRKGFVDPQVRVQSVVTLNGRRSQPFIDPEVDLAKEPYSLAHRAWVLPYKNSNP